MTQPHMKLGDMTLPNWQEKVEEFVINEEISVEIYDCEQKPLKVAIVRSEEKSFLIGLPTRDWSYLSVRENLKRENVRNGYDFKKWRFQLLSENKIHCEMNYDYGKTIFSTSPKPPETLVVALEQLTDKEITWSGK